MVAPAQLENSLAGRYRLQREIGAGGMATVYLAEDLRHGRQVAIKVLKPEIAELIGRDRFLSEIRTTAVLQHPLILPLFDSGEAGDHLFYVMPYVTGGTLRTRLASGPAFSESESLSMIAELAEALDYAHRRGIVHRDVKPENILLHEDAPLLSDFGIALRTGERDLGRMTEAGIVIGTRGYMSPEQLSGQLEIDGRTDQYSLASVLSEMLSAAQGEARMTSETATRSRSDVAAHGSAGSVATQNVPWPAGSAGFGQPLDELIARATARDPGHRFESMAAFADALRAIGTSRPAVSPKSIAVLAFENMSGERDNDYFAEGMSEEIINALAGIPQLRTVARASSFSFKGVREDLRVIGEKLRVGHVLEGTVRKAGKRLRITVQLIDVESGYQVWSERYDRLLDDVFAIQDEIAKTIVSKLELTLARDRGGVLIQPRTNNLEAYEEYLKGMALMHRRGAGILEAIECFRRAIALDAEFAPALAGLSHALVLSSFWGMSDPRETGPLAVDAARQALLADPNSADAQVASALVAICVEFDRSAAAEAWDRAVHLAPTDGVVRAMRAIFHHCYILGDFESSIRELRLALDRDPLNAVLHTHVSLVLVFSDRAEEALVEAQRAIELDPLAMYGQWTRVFALIQGRHYERAIETATETMRRFGRHGWFMHGLALAHARLGRQDKAQAFFDEMVARSRTEHVQRPLLAVMAMALGRRQEALDYWIRAAEERDPIMVPYLLRSSFTEELRRQPEHHALVRKLGWDRPFSRSAG